MTFSNYRIRQIIGLVGVIVCFPLASVFWWAKIIGLICFLQIVHVYFSITRKFMCPACKKPLSNLIFREQSSNVIVIPKRFTVDKIHCPFCGMSFSPNEGLVNENSKEK